MPTNQKIENHAHIRKSIKTKRRSFSMNEFQLIEEKQQTIFISDENKLTTVIHDTDKLQQIFFIRKAVAGIINGSGSIFGSSADRVRKPKDAMGKKFILALKTNTENLGQDMSYFHIDPYVNLFLNYFKDFTNGSKSGFSSNFKIPDEIAFDIDRRIGMMRNDSYFRIIFKSTQRACNKNYAVISNGFLKAMRDS